MAAKDEKRDVNRRVMFEELGKGVYLMLRNSGVRVLHNLYGKEHIRIVNEAFLIADIEILERLLELMAHKGEEKFEVNFDDIDHISLQTLSDKLRDAWSLAVHGRTHDDQIEHVKKLLEELKEAGEEAKPDPFETSPQATSDTSSDTPTGQA